MCHVSAVVVLRLRYFSERTRAVRERKRRKPQKKAPNVFRAQLDDAYHPRQGAIAGYPPVACRTASVLVVVLAVRCVPAPVVHVVDMVPMRHGHMTTAVAVDVAVILVHGVAGWFAFVVVIVVPSMKVTVVHVVDMVTMRDRDMTASFAVDVVMINVFAVSCAGHRFSPPFPLNFDS
jgi:hypothetical protein